MTNMVERYDFKKYEDLKKYASDLLYEWQTRKHTKITITRMLKLVDKVKHEAERRLEDAKTPFEQSVLQGIVEDCDVAKELLVKYIGNKKDRRETKEILDLRIEGIDAGARRLCGETNELDPGYAPEEAFVPDLGERKEPWWLEEAREFYEAEYGDY